MKLKSARKPERIPKEGEVWFKNGLEKGRHYFNMRRIISVHQGWVFYSDGGNKNGACTVDAFQQWMIGASEVQREPIKELAKSE